MSGHPDHLGPGGQEVQDPGAQGGDQSLLSQLASQCGGDYGVESRAIVNNNMGDSVVCGPVWPVGELLMVHGGR